MTLIGCANARDVDSGEVVATTVLPLLGDHLSGISNGDFNEAKAAFSNVENVNDGVGPIFNEVSCGNCHVAGAVGGASDVLERRFGRFDGFFDPLANEGGSLRQLKTLGNWTNSSGTACSVPLEVEPADATVHNVGRLTTPLFGLGLVDAMPDAFFVQLAQAEPAAVRGLVNSVPIALPDPADPTQSVGAMRVGRFGWKAGVPSLVQFAADAYVNEMGITTQHCFQGTSITAFATESAPNGIPVAPECEDNLPGVDDAVGSCANNLTEIQDDVAEFTAFMTFLSPPARDRSDDDLESPDSVAPEGRRLFDSTGCSGCHSRQAFITPRRPANGVPGTRKFFPFSDFLVHDMGSLGDQIGNLGDTLEATRRMRTAPLWGIRFRPRLLHDGRAGSVAEAIAAHDGQGAASAQAFGQLNTTAQQTLVQFVLSL
jgi:CxxC motif-containing protein (DUF1111 family)